MATFSGTNFRDYLTFTSAVLVCLGTPRGVHAQANSAPAGNHNPPIVATVSPSTPSHQNQTNAALLRSGDAFKKGDIETAIKETEAALKEDEKQPDTLNWYGFLLLQANRPVEAIVALDKAVALGGETAELETNLGTALLLKPGATSEDIKRAVTLLEKAVSAKPKMLEALMNLGHAYLRAGRANDAVPVYQRVLEQQPTNAAIIRMYGSALVKSGQTSEAMVAFRRATDINPKDGEAWGILGSLELQQGRTAMAQETLEKAYKLGHANPTTLSNLALIYTQQKKFDEAASLYGEAADLSDTLTPPNFLPRINQGIAYAREQKWKEAGVAYEKVLAIDAHYYDALINLGSIRYQQGRFEEATTYFTTASTERPEQAVAWANLASTLDSTHHYNESVIAWNKAVSIEPANRTYVDSLHSAMVRAGKNDSLIENARDEAKHSKSAEPLNELGSALVNKAETAPKATEKQENLTAALLTFQKATKREPNSAKAWNNLGVVYERRGQINQAINAYKRAVRLDSKFTEAHDNLIRIVPTYGKSPVTKVGSPIPTQNKPKNNGLVKP